jgi:hypothetical protein
MRQRCGQCFSSPDGKKKIRRLKGQENIDVSQYTKYIQRSVDSSRKEAKTTICDTIKRYKTPPCLF